MGFPLSTIGANGRALVENRQWHWVLFIYTRIHTERSAIRLNVVVTSVAATDAAAAVISHCSNEDQLFAFNCALIQTHTHSFPLSATYSKWFSLFLYDKSKQGCSSVHQHWH